MTAQTAMLPDASASPILFKAPITDATLPPMPIISGPPRLEVFDLTKRFGPFTALDKAQLSLPPGSFHAILGENGAGKSTLVKCIMGYYRADEGRIVIDKQELVVRHTHQAHALGIGMVYQHFTLVGNMTVAENLVLSGDHIPFFIPWRQEYKKLDAFMETMPFRLPLHTPVRALAAGEKQKLEILKQLYLRRKLLILDEPTSVLTPQEADDVLGLLHGMVKRGDISVLMITHKFREVMAFADQYTVLRRGKWIGAGPVKGTTSQQLAGMMVGSEQATVSAKRGATRDDGEVRMTLRQVKALDDLGLPAVNGVNLELKSGEIVGIAGVSGNGQSELVEVLAGQRQLASGDILVHGEMFNGTRSEIRRHKIHCMPEEPLHNTCVRHMSVAQNMAFRDFDRSPFAIGRVILNQAAMRRRADDLIGRFGVKTRSASAPIRSLSGGNVQRAVLAREISKEVEVLIIANPCFGLDFSATAEIRARIMEMRNSGAAVLLVSEDLDELMELADRILVMFDGRFAYQTPRETADIPTIGRHMAGHGEAEH